MAVQDLDVSVCQNPVALAEALELHPRALGQLLQPDVYVAVRPAAMAGTFLSEELYRMVSHKVTARPAQEVLREYLCHLLRRLRQQDDALCGMEHGCDVFAPPAWPEWKPEQIAQEEKERRAWENERIAEEDAEQKAIWAAREHGDSERPRTKRLPRTFTKPADGLERWEDLAKLTELEDMRYALYEDGFETVGDLMRCTEHELAQYENLGKRGARRIVQAFQSRNMQPSLWPSIWGDPDISDQEAWDLVWQAELERDRQEAYADWLASEEKERRYFATGGKEKPL